MAGRLAIFEDCPKITNYEDYQGNDFANEKSLCDFIHSNAEIFATDVLEIKYAGHDREYFLSGDSRIKSISAKGRVDFCFYHPEGLVLVECKNPKHTYAEISKSIGQILGYSCLAERYRQKVYRYVLVTTVFDAVASEIVEKFSLPIEIYIVSKKHALKLWQRQ